MNAGRRIGGLTAALFLVCAGMASAQTDITRREETRGAETTTTHQTKTNTVTVYERTEVVREVKEVQVVKKDRYKCAIFVTNRAVERIPDKKVLNMQDYFTAHATDGGFSVIAREDVVNSVSKYAMDGPNRGDPRLPGATLDEALSNNASALRLTQMMGADYILVVSITNYGINRQKYVDPAAGINLLGLTHQMKTTFKLLDGVGGGSLTAGVQTLTVKQRIDPRVQEEDLETVVDDLLDACAARLADDLIRSKNRGNVPAPDPVAGAEVPIFIHCSVADMVFPEVVKDNNTGQYVVTAGTYRLEAIGFQVELDGVLIGSTSLTRPLYAKPGLHKLRLKRPLFRDHESNLKVTEPRPMVDTTNTPIIDKVTGRPQLAPMLIDITMELSAEGFAEFKDMTRFFNQLKKDAIMTDAQAKMWEHYMDQMRKEGLQAERQGPRAGGGPGPRDYRDEILGTDRNRPETPRRPD